MKFCQFMVKLVRSVAVIFLILFCIYMLLTSCDRNYFEPQPNIELGWPIDNSDSPMNVNRDNAEQMHDYILTQIIGLESDEDVYSGGVRIYIMVMGASSRPKVKIIELNPGKADAWETKDNRMKEIKLFKEKLLAALEEATSQPLHEPSSYLHHAIAYAGDLFENSDFEASTQLMYCFTDGIQNSEGVNFNDYIYNLDEFEEEFSNISDALNKDWSLPNMTGVEINMVSSPEAGFSQQMLYYNRFWQKHLEQANATFYSQSSLGN